MEHTHVPDREQHLMSKSAAIFVLLCATVILLMYSGYGNHTGWTFTELLFGEQ